MDLSRKWLTEFVDVPVSAVNDKEFSEAMTLSGSKVETYEDHSAQFKNVVVGRILSMERHPDSDPHVDHPRWTWEKRMPSKSAPVPGTSM